MLPPGDNLGRIVRSQLTTALAPLLQKALGGRPELILSQLEDQSLSDEGQAARLAALKETPAIQALMAELPGKLERFLPEAPAPEPETDEEKIITETETNEDPPQEEPLEE